VTPVLCLITDGGRDPRGADATVERVTWAARTGVHLVQVRERHLDGRVLTALVRRCVEAVRGSRARVLVNDRLDVALAAGAHGVHLRADSMSAARIRPLCPAGFVVGRSAHARDEAMRVVDEGGLDYLLFGTVFRTLSKPGQAPAGVEALAAVASAVPVPVLAVGGVSPDNVNEVAAAGAAGLAAIGLFAAESEPALHGTVAAVRSAFASVSRP
jgi:thiamine-phosphate pyrophosphorylase